MDMSGLRNRFSTPLHIQIYANKIRVSTLDLPQRHMERIPQEPFTTPRLLVGNFKSAEKCLADAISELTRGKWMKKSFRVVIQPMEMAETGLCEVEERVLSELASSAGAHEVVIHVGALLSREQALDMV
ncbi:hypothetical protein FV139_14540 [Parahaliea maris]|uniref:Uncharacterized protein n=1 Tax=Parahaliea maris TaxID=2716870 RepID=A0A5C8ZXJ5_9GAMM|nr:hypothetical protein [Parahaliea maris]TXS91941.1 hypothetical protein FV139_14540 [Parahaliea maris]